MRCLWWFLALILVAWFSPVGTDRVHAQCPGGICPAARSAGGTYVPDFGKRLDGGFAGVPMVREIREPIMYYAEAPVVVYYCPCMTAAPQAGPAYYNYPPQALHREIRVGLHRYR